MDAIGSRKALIGVIGLGYVGISPLAAVQGRYRALGFDINPDRTEQINRSESFIKHIPSTMIAEAVKGKFKATTDFALLSNADAILICVPTPLTRHREPDLTYVENTVRAAAKRLRPGQLIVLESTTYPGTTVKAILEETGLRTGIDFLLAFSPERQDRATLH
jgi:UDP-N-acetyl-D-glucosamine dehydrogenase